MTRYHNRFGGDAWNRLSVLQTRFAFSARTHPARRCAEAAPGGTLTEWINLANTRATPPPTGRVLLGGRGVEHENTARAGRVVEASFLQLRQRRHSGGTTISQIFCGG